MFILVFSVFLINTGFSQNTIVIKKQLREYRNNPHWISMMKDSSVKFADAVTAFDEFWKGKPSPEELMEGESETSERSIVSRIFYSEKQEKADILAFAEDHKRFLYWKQKNELYVKPDGTVMSAEEKQALVKQELENRKK